MNPTINTISANELTNEREYERTNERTNEQTKLRTNEQTDERMNERTTEQANKKDKKNATKMLLHVNIFGILVDVKIRSQYPGYITLCIRLLFMRTNNKKKSKELCSSG